jgi:hypothetical protein
LVIDDSWHQAYGTPQVRDNNCRQSRERENHMPKTPVRTRPDADWRPTPTNLGNWSADLEERVMKLEERVAHVDECIGRFITHLDGLHDEVRTRRLVVVDDAGRERIFTKMTSEGRGAALHVRTPGGKTQVEIVANDEAGDAYAGMYLFDAEGVAVVELVANEMLGGRGRTAAPVFTLRDQGDRVTGYSTRTLDMDTLDVILYLYESGLLAVAGDE